MNSYLCSWWRLLQPRHLVVALLACVLTGCVNKDIGDLQTFINEIKKRPAQKIDNLPEIKPYEKFLYAAYELRDPFEPLIELQSTPQPQPQSESEPTKPTSKIRPDLNRNKEMLENYPLDSLRMLGTLEKHSERWGVVRSPDGTVYPVKIGNFMGQNHGRIVQVDADRILITEIVSDGEIWQERQAAVALSE